MRNKSERQEHTFPPVYDKNSAILILGSFPSVKSRELGFYYGHPQNRFWKLLAELYHEELPQNTEQKKTFLIRHRIALWDVIKSCEITGSSDTSIRNVIPNPLEEVLAYAAVETIYANGRTSEKLYNRYLKDKTGREITVLPSTSPANAACSFEKLVLEWGRLLNIT